MSDVMNKKLIVTMPSGARFSVPVSAIANSRAAYYAQVDNISLEDSLNEDTIPEFADDFEIKDWAANNMDWTDVSDVSELLSGIKDADDGEHLQEGWMNGDKRVED